MSLIFNRGANNPGDDWKLSAILCNKQILVSDSNTGEQVLYMRQSQKTKIVNPDFTETIMLVAVVPKKERKELFYFQLYFLIFLKFFFFLWRLLLIFICGAFPEEIVCYLNTKLRFQKGGCQVTESGFQSYSLCLESDCTLLERRSLLFFYFCSKHLLKLFSGFTEHKQKQMKSMQSVHNQATQTHQRQRRYSISARHGAQSAASESANVLVSQPQKLKNNLKCFQAENHALCTKYG